MQAILTSNNTTNNITYNDTLNNTSKKKPKQLSRFQKLIKWGLNNSLN